MANRLLDEEIRGALRDLQTQITFLKLNLDTLAAVLIQKDLATEADIHEAHRRVFDAAVQAEEETRDDTIRQDPPEEIR